MLFSDPSACWELNSGNRCYFLRFAYFIIYFELCRVFVAACGLSQVAESRGYSSCGVGLLIAVAPLGGAQALVVVARGLSCSAACGIFPDQGLNPFLLHWQEDS